MTGGTTSRARPGGVVWTSAGVLAALALALALMLPGGSEERELGRGQPVSLELWDGVTIRAGTQLLRQGWHAQFDPGGTTVRIELVIANDSDRTVEPMFHVAMSARRPGGSETTVEDAISGIAVHTATPPGASTYFVTGRPLAQGTEEIALTIEYRDGSDTIVREATVPLEWR